MIPVPRPLPVVMLACTTCRLVYEPELADFESGNTGCPRCGGWTWIAQLGTAEWSALTCTDRAVHRPQAFDSTCPRPGGHSAKNGRRAGFLNHWQVIEVIAMVRVNTCVTVHCGLSGEVSPGGLGSDACGGGVTVDRGWRGRAVCRSEDPELFFPVGDSGPALVQIADARAVCGRCPVVAECLSFALVALPDGVAGGLTAQERRELRGARRRASRSPAARTAGRSERLPGGVDGLVVATLMAGAPVSGASRQELAHAAVGLHLAGHGAGWIGARLGVHDQQVYRWVERHRAGKPLIGTAGRRGRVSA